MVTCPKCSQLLGEIGPAGTLESVCGSCRYKFFVLQGRLTAGSSRLSTIRPDTYQSRGSYEREYDFRVELPSGRVEAVGFKLPGEDDTVAVQRGDRIAVIYLMRGAEREELLDVYDLTTGKRYPVATPGGRSRMLAGAPAAILSIVVFAVLGQLTVPIEAALATSAAVLGVSWYFIARKWAPVHILAPGAQASLEARQQLLISKREMQQLRSAAITALEGRSLTRDRLVSLRNKMREVGSDVYGERIAVVTRGIGAIEEQIQLDRQLVDGYAKSIAMIEIEYETGVAADAIAPEGGSPIQAKLEELKALSERQADLHRQFAANDEVAALLRGSGT